MTTFITLYGRFYFLRAPMGLSIIGDEFCRRGDAVFAGLQNFVKVVDDILIYNKDYETHLHRVYELLLRCQWAGIMLNADKFVLAAPSASFCGYGVSTDGVIADDEKVRAIRDFPTPANITDLRSFMGLVNQLADFTADIAA